MLKRYVKSHLKNRAMILSVIISLVILATGLYLKIGYYKYGYSLQGMNPDFFGKSFLLFIVPIIAVLWFLAAVLYAIIKKLIHKQKVKWFFPAVLIVSASILFYFERGLVYYEFKGFCDGIKTKLITEELHRWTKKQISLNENESVIIDCGKADMGSLSKVGQFQCKEAFIEPTENGKYYVIMYWGGGLLGSHGIIYGTDTEKVMAEISKFNSSVEVVSGIYAWMQ
ncbi:hypothetical protein L21SP3_02264 [Sedimentisphaera cyanobacteriorum]|uniref:Uncharacterized protein n=1 Tax=Sedimentisphaera cyanobacteriorum TaxID=1940790 RepID=A0A1Q2HSK9_9BACT|nr:hypothetical protein [Sedimentisphaera cyanobacteriorum]AQQ10432.1 hypothetical protein L21SP3_02264 [Sedimentisphaera cyanobacteriorum]